MAKQIIRLTESELHQVIEESVKRIINESPSTFAWLLNKTLPLANKIAGKSYNTLSNAAKANKEQQGKTGAANAFNAARNLYNKWSGKNARQQNVSQRQNPRASQPTGNQSGIR